jgi:hypothetical protein
MVFSSFLSGSLNLLSVLIPSFETILGFMGSIPAFLVVRLLFLSFSGSSRCCPHAPFLFSSFLLLFW